MAVGATSVDPSMAGLASSELAASQEASTCWGGDWGGSGVAGGTETGGITVSTACWDAVGSSTTGADLGAARASAGACPDDISAAPVEDLTSWGTRRGLRTG